MYLYHATYYKNLGPIMRDGLKVGMDGSSYFCTEPHHAVNWIELSNVNGEDILCLPIEIEKLDQNLISDGIDHDPVFFKGITVKTYDKTIPFNMFDLDKLMKYVSRHKELG